MPNTFKNKVATAIGTSLTILYTAPSVTTTALIGLACSNITGSNVTVSIIVEDVSATTSVYIVKNAPIPVGSSLVAIGGDQKVILETGDRIKIQSNTAAAIDAILSMMEIT